jgi:hypothetical protein
VRVQQLLERQRRVEALVHREQTPADEIARRWSSNSSTAST